MKILIAGSINEYSSHEEEAIALLLAAEFKAKGHIVDSFLLPYKPDPLIIPDQLLAISMLDVSAAELLITVGYPACTLTHPNKIIYLLETAPMLHEYWDSEYGVLGSRQYSDILITLNNIEKRCFTEAKKVFCNSELLSKDLHTRYGINSERLEFPVLEPKFTASTESMYDDYYLVESCLLQNSRVFEFTELLKGKSSVKICIFVPEADPVYFESLKRIIRSLAMDSVISVFDGQPSDNAIKKAKAYLHFPYESRRADNILKRCVCLGTSVIVAKDSGYGAELADKTGGVIAVDFNDILSKKISSAVHTVSNSFGTAKKFAESVMGL